MSAREKISLKGYDKYGGLDTFFKLRDLAKEVKNQDYRYASPSIAALLQREDYGSNPNQGAFYLPEDHLRNIYRLLNIDERQALSGIYLRPENFRGIPEDYIKGHETQHAISKSMTSGQHNKSLSQGSSGYLPLPGKKSRNEFNSYSGIENWLMNYPENQRNEERAAHKRGLSWIGRFPKEYYKEKK